MSQLGQEITVERNPSLRDEVSRAPTLTDWLLDMIPER
jgi:hypothetical protein